MLYKIQIQKGKLFNNNGCMALDRYVYKFVYYPTNHAYLKLL